MIFFCKNRASDFNGSPVFHENTFFMKKFHDKNKKDKLGKYKK